MGKRILFLCGSPRRKQSASLYTAKYLARFLDYGYEFLDVVGARLSTDSSEAEPAFLYPSPGSMNAVLRFLFKNKRLEKRLTATRQRQLERDRKKRLEGYLQSGGRLGKGREVSG